MRTGVLAALEQLGRAPELYAVTVDGDGRARPARQPRAGVDRRSALGAAQPLGRARADGGALPATSGHDQRVPARLRRATVTSSAAVGASAACSCVLLAVERDRRDLGAARQRVADVEPRRPGRVPVSTVVV